MPTARTARLQPRRSFGRAACAVAFMSARAAATRYRKRRRGRTARRARVEHVFGAQQTSPGGRLVRTIGIMRAKAKIGLQNLAYNIRRLVTLERFAAA